MFGPVRPGTFCFNNTIVSIISVFQISGFYCIYICIYMYMCIPLYVCIYTLYYSKTFNATKVTVQDFLYFNKYTTLVGQKLCVKQANTVSSYRKRFEFLNLHNHFPFKYFMSTDCQRFSIGRSQ